MRAETMEGRTGEPVAVRVEGEVDLVTADRDAALRGVARPGSRRSRWSSRPR